MGKLIIPLLLSFFCCAQEPIEDKPVVSMATIHDHFTHGQAERTDIYTCDAADWVLHFDFSTFHVDSIVIHLCDEQYDNFGRRVIVEIKKGEFMPKILRVQSDSSVVVGWDGFIDGHWDISDTDLATCIYQPIPFHVGAFHVYQKH